MIYDNLTISLLDNLFDYINRGVEPSKYRLAIDYNWQDKPKYFETENEKNNFYKKKAMMIEYRLRSMADEGLLGIKMNGKIKIYELDGKRVLKCKHKFFNGYFLSIQIKEKNGKWVIFQI